MGASGRFKVLMMLVLGLCFSLGPVSPISAYHFPWDQAHDTTDWNDPPDPGPCKGDTCDPCKSTGSPVYLPTGHLIWSETDILLPGEPEISLTRTYNSHDARTGLFGNGWTVCGDVGFYPVKGSEFTDGGTGTVTVERFVLRTANGKRYIFEKNADGSVTPPDGRFERVEFLPDGMVRLIDLDGSSRTFDFAGRILQKADAAGNAVNYQYDASGMLEKIADTNGRFLLFHYSSSGRVSEVGDHVGRRWLFSYNFRGDLTGVTDPLGNARRFEYGSHTPTGDAHVYSQLTRIFDETGVTITSVVYSGERVTSYTEGENRFTYAYNTGTRTVTKTDLLSNRWTYVYNGDGLITRKTNPLNQTTFIEFDANGRPTKITDQLNRVWLSTYDSLGRPASHTNPLGETAVTEYEGDNPRPARIVSPSGRVTELEYDARGRLVRLTDPAGSVYLLSWDEQGRLTGAQDPLGNRSVVQNDAMGRPVAVTDPLARTTRFAYDAYGNMVLVENAAGHETQFAYDALGRVVSSTDPSGAVSRYEYDPAGRLASLVDPKGNTTTFTYDAYGRLSQRTAPLGRTIRYQYRRDNLLSQVTLEDGRTISYAYDAAKRLTQENAGGDIISYEYNSKGEITKATNTAVTVVFGYDPAGRLDQEIQNGRAVATIRNAEGERIRMTALGDVVEYARDPRGAIKTITTPAGIFDLGYDALGRRHRLQMPTGASVDYRYDPAGQLSELTHLGAFQAFYRYDYDPAGLISRISGDGADWEYDYDPVGSLAQARHGLETFTYNYDPAGNRIGEGQQYDAANRLLEDAENSYSYDLRGNLTEKRSKITGARTVFTWNARNQLLRIDEYASAASTSPQTVMSFTYDPLGRRYSRNHNGAVESYLYDGPDRIATLGSSGQVVNKIYFGPEIDEPLAGLIDQQYLYYHTNHLGSVMALSNEGSNVPVQYAYDPFGRTEEMGQASNPFRYTGREHELDDLYYYRARYYNASIGRFLSEDPIGFEGGDYNLYRYVQNNPANFTDPFGESQWHFDYSSAGERFIHYGKYRFNQAGKLVEHTGKIIGEAKGDALKALKHLINVKPEFFRVAPVIIIDPCILAPDLFPGMCNTCPGA